MIAANFTGTLTFASVSADAGLERALQKSRPDLIADVSASGLKGRGGAGFPTGVKWNLAAAARSDVKYVICNADEGEPGTFKDRVILSDHADLVFAGMTIAGYAIGATKGILYLRGEYAYLRAHLERVLATRRERHLLGEVIHGKAGLRFDIQIRLGSGAYVCGEETALIESLEGHRGEPRNRPPFPVDTGLERRPSVVNNVETFAWVTSIFDRGVDWFKAIGTGRSVGPKILSVSGDCARPGVYEVPFGTTLAALLEEVGGQDARAVQVGGASGICVPAGEFHRAIAFEDVATGGSIIVFGEHRDLLHVARNFLEFFVEESCGQCTPCREGTAQLLEGVELLERGACSTAHLAQLTSLCQTMRLASKCGLGQSAPNAFLSIMQHFHDELMGRRPEGTLPPAASVGR
ncbi:MAG: NADH-ubiquinone oxidoreductase-F iron-sulfur binding region domain-containing protein [Myxococcota bacterium]|jgi:[NiFe] hydrogenase diaphorase moiety large subunit|nr:NADH-ubiquinone oxidoreductase-F iron-sulfur binding region domain-containing protein [Myxococcota bacterium]